MVKVLRDTGHPNAAREVAIAFEEQRHKAGKIKGLAAILHRIYGALVGYGHRPMRLLGIVFGVWLGCAVLYHYAAVGGVFGPSQPAVFQNPDYAPCRPDYVREADKEKREKLGNWYWCKLLREEYSTFNPYLYSLDLILPVVDLQQEKDWAPIIPTPRRNDKSELVFENFLRDVSSLVFDNWRLAHVVRIAMWIEIIFGWAASLLLVSVLSGLAKRME
jgi:hypothetical protein